MIRTDLGPKKGVILTPNIAKIFHLTPDIEAKNIPDTDTQNSPRYSTPTFQKPKKKKKKKIPKTFPKSEQNLSWLWLNFLFGIVLIKKFSRIRRNFFLQHTSHYMSVSSKANSVTIKHEHCLGSLFMWGDVFSWGWTRTCSLEVEGDQTFHAFNANLAIRNTQPSLSK